MAGEDRFGILVQAARFEVGQGGGRNVGQGGVGVVLFEAPHAREGLLVVLLLHGELLLLRGLQAVLRNSVHSLVDLAVIAHAVEGFLLFAMVFGFGLGVQDGIERLLAVFPGADELVEFVAGGGRQVALDAIQVAARAVRLVVFQQAVDDAGVDGGHAAIAIGAELEVVFPQGFVVFRLGVAMGMAEAVFQLVVGNGGAAAIERIVGHLARIVGVHRQAERGAEAGLRCVGIEYAALVFGMLADQAVERAQQGGGCALEHAALGIVAQVVDGLLIELAHGILQVAIAADGRRAALVEIAGVGVVQQGVHAVQPAGLGVFHPAFVHLGGAHGVVGIKGRAAIGRAGLADLVW